MKFKLLPLIAGFFAITFAVAPLAAQACDKSDDDRSSVDSNFPETTQTSVSIT